MNFNNLSKICVKLHHLEMKNWCNKPIDLLFLLYGPLGDAAYGASQDLYSLQADLQLGVMTRVLAIAEHLSWSCVDIRPRILPLTVNECIQASSLVGQISSAYHFGKTEVINFGLLSYLI